MPIIYIQDSVSVDSFERESRAVGLDPKQVIFLFPGNSSHHRPGITMFSVKSGGGLANAANQLGREGYATLSLPTTTMEKWSKDKSQQEVVQEAIVTVYRALGAGYSIMIPVRPHQGSLYFSGALDNTNNLEPSFWGGIQSAANVPLADHYLKHINKLHAILRLSEEERQQWCNNNASSPFVQAFIEGQNDKIDFSLKKKPKATNTRRKQNKISPTDTLAQELISPKQNDAQLINNALILLNDYTQFNSAWLRFWHCYWNRHHVREVNVVVQKVNDNQITTLDDLLVELNKIELVNQNGSLARHIKEIENMRDKDAAHKLDILTL